MSTRATIGRSKKRTKKTGGALISQVDFKRLLDEHTNGEQATPWKVFTIMSEFVNGFEFLRHHKKAVTIFGSARSGFPERLYRDARVLAHRLAKDGFAVITGGGPGIMEAANRGAYDAGGVSVGLNIKLKHEQHVNQYVTASEDFRYFFARKTMLSLASQICIFFPGGYGTLDELFDILTLIQTEKVPRVPVILVNKEYWAPLLEWMREHLWRKHRAVERKDLGLFHVADDADEAYRLIRRLIREKKVPL
ncbi:MAG: TIGR00730 family Rossman fold protein [Patescibacteria group bacterium]